MTTTDCRGCGHIACICNTLERHAEDCKFRVSVACPVGIECEHGYDVCPTCDPCTCGTEVGVEDFGGKPTTQQEA